MTYKQFKQIMFTEFQGLDPEYDIYYWNLWNDSVKLDIKHGDTPDFDNFISLVSEGAR